MAGRVIKLMMILLPSLKNDYLVDFESPEDHEKDESMSNEQISDGDSRLGNQDRLKFTSSCVLRRAVASPGWCVPPAVVISTRHSRDKGR